MDKLIHMGLILTALLGILHLASAGNEGLADYSQDCLTNGELSDRSFPGTLFYLSPDQHLWRTEDNWQPELVLPETRVLHIIDDRNYSPQKLLVVEDTDPATFTIINASGEFLDSVRWQAEWTSVSSLTQDDRLIVERKTGHSEDTGIAFVTFSGQTTYFTDFPSALVVNESNSLSNTTGFYVSPDGQFVVYDAFFEAENKLTSQRGLALADISSKREVWRTRENYIWGEFWSHPHWSPDGTQFAYVNQDHNYLYHEDFDIEIAMVDRSGQERIVTDFNVAGATFRFPDWLYWSPDGNKIAFWMRDVTYEIDRSNVPEDRLGVALHIYDLSMNTVYDLCVDERLSSALTWSPDSRALAYGSTDNIRLVDLESHAYGDLPLEVASFSRLEWLAD